MLIRGETVLFSKQKARKTREQEDKQIDTINKLQDAFNNNPTQRCLQQLEEAKSSLENIRKPKIKGLITRSRVQWHEDGERCSKYFLSLEKRKYIWKSIQCIKVDNKTVTSKPKILDLFSQSLSRKYTEQSAPTNSNIYFQDNIKKKLSEAQKRALDEPLSFEELRVALMKMKKGKSPRSNGFTADFFKHFWKILGIFLYRPFLESVQNGTTLHAHRESIVTLIPKPGKSTDTKTR